MHIVPATIQQDAAAGSSSERAAATIKPGDSSALRILRRADCNPGSACPPPSLPLAGKMNRMPPAEPPARTLLIVERDQSVRRLQTLFLERAGFKVEFADDGMCALECAIAAPPAAVITEILVPKMDGLALCRALRAEPRTRTIPIIVFSILGAAQRASEAGATLFLRKPLVDSTFVAAVQTVTAAWPPMEVETQ